MPPRLRRQMDALRSQTDGVPWGGGPGLDAGVLTTLAQACRDDEPMHLRPTPPRDGEPTDRWVEPHRLVSLGRRWYLVAYDRDRQDWRSFRVDRISRAAQPTGQRFRPRELPAEDALVVRAGRHPSDAAAVRRTRPASRPALDEVDVVRRPLGDGIEPDGDGCVMTMNVDTLDWPMMVLAHLDADFTVEQPPELVDAGRPRRRALRRSARPGSAQTNTPLG